MAIAALGRVGGVGLIRLRQGARLGFAEAGNFGNFGYCKTTTGQQLACDGKGAQFHALGAALGLAGIELRRCFESLGDNRSLTVFGQLPDMLRRSARVIR